MYVILTEPKQIVASLLRKQKNTRTYAQAYIYIYKHDTSDRYPLKVPITHSLYTEKTNPTYPYTYAPPIDYTHLQ